MNGDEVGCLFFRAKVLVLSKIFFYLLKEEDFCITTKMPVNHFEFNSFKKSKFFYKNRNCAIARVIETKIFFTEFGHLDKRKRDCQQG